MKKRLLRAKNRRKSLSSFRAAGRVVVVALFASTASIDSPGCSTTTTTSSSSIVADAFTIPKLRTRTPSHHQSSSIVSTTTTTTSTTTIRSSKAPLEFAQCSGEELRSKSTTTSSVFTKSATEKDNDDDNERERNDQEVVQAKNGNKLPLNGRAEDKSPPPGSPLSMLCQDVNEEDPFELHLGRALDALKSDYPKMLTKQPGK